MEQPILITGAARSGTSMVAGAINLCGAFGGKMSGANHNHNNKKGMFENAHIRDNIVTPYLRALNVDPKGQFPLPDVYNLKPDDTLRNRVENVFKQQGYKQGRWMYKGAKMALFWPIWASAFPSAKWIIVRRRTGGIVNSCMHTGFMSAFAKKFVQKAAHVPTEKDGWIWWVRQHEKRFEEMLLAKLNIKFIWPHKMIDGNFEELKQAIEWLGLEWNEKEVKEFIEPKLYNSKGI
jgi:hypothetical protein